MPDIDPTLFRHVLGHVPTCVVVVTAQTPDGPAGLAVGSFTSVSLNPPLIGFLPARTSETWPLIRSASSFCVNVLADDQAEVARNFAQTETDRFADQAWSPAPYSRAPVLKGILAWLDCTIDTVADAGDHWWVQGLVHQLAVEREGLPLVFFRGGYGSLSL